MIKASKAVLLALVWLTPQDIIFPLFPQACGMVPGNASRMNLELVSSQKDQSIGSVYVSKAITNTGQECEHEALQT